VIADGAIGGVARVLRGGGDVPELRARSAAALLRRLSVLAASEPAVILDDADDLRLTLARLGIPRSQGTAQDGPSEPNQMPPADYAGLRHALDIAVAQSQGADTDPDVKAELDALCRRQLARWLTCLPLPRQEGEYEPLTPPEGK
jgi:hypothetical protein